MKSIQKNLDNTVEIEKVKRFAIYYPDILMLNIEPFDEFSHITKTEYCSSEDLTQLFIYL